MAHDIKIISYPGLGLWVGHLQMIYPIGHESCMTQSHTVSSKEKGAPNSQIGGNM